MFTFNERLEGEVDGVKAPFKYPKSARGPIKPVKLVSKVNYVLLEMYKYIGSICYWNLEG